MKTFHDVAPDTFDALNQLALQIEQGESAIHLGPSSLLLLQSLLSDPTKTAVSTITTLASSNQVNPSTLTRLSQRLGYQKFSAFQQTFRDHLERNDRFYTERVNRLLANDDQTNTNNTLLNNIIQEEINNISALAKGDNEAHYEHIAKLFAKARYIRFHGRRQFYSLSCFFVYGLGLIRDGVGFLQNEVDGISYALTFMGKKDVLVVMGCNPYTKTTVDACRVAQAQAIPVVALTDSAQSPLARYADHTLVVNTESAYYNNSMGAAFVLAEGLLALTAKRLGNKALSTLKKREKIINEFGISLNTNQAHRHESDPPSTQ